MVTNLLHQLQKDNNNPSQEKRKKKKEKKRWRHNITLIFFLYMLTIIELETKVDDCPAHDQNVELRIVFI